MRLNETRNYLILLLFFVLIPFREFHAAYVFTLPVRYLDRMYHMARTPFPARYVVAVKAVQDAQVDYFDTKHPRLELRVTSNGRKTWFIMYRSQGRLRRFPIATYPNLGLVEAGKQAAVIRNAVAQDDDSALH
jgi:hypothetical protein